MIESRSDVMGVGTAPHISPHTTTINHYLTQTNKTYISLIIVIITFITSPIDNIIVPITTASISS